MEIAPNQKRKDFANKDSSLRSERRKVDGLGIKNVAAQPPHFFPPQN